MTKILNNHEVLGFTRPKPNKKRQRVEEPEVHTRIDDLHGIWEMYICAYRGGRFIRLDMPFDQAARFLETELNRVREAVSTGGHVEGEPKE